MSGRPKGSKQSPEAIEKMRQANVARWKDPAYRARHVARLKAMQPEAVKLAAEVKRCRPPMGTPEYRLYTKIARELGVEVARSLQW